MNLGKLKQVLDGESYVVQSFKIRLGLCAERSAGRTLACM